MYYAHNTACSVDLLFNDMSTIVYHYVSYPRDRAKNDRRAIREEEREIQGRLRKT